MREAEQAFDPAFAQQTEKCFRLYLFKRSAIELLKQFGDEIICEKTVLA